MKLKEDKEEANTETMARLDNAQVVRPAKRRASSRSTVVSYAMVLRATTNVVLLLFVDVLTAIDLGSRGQVVE